MIGYKLKGFHIIDTLNAYLERMNLWYTFIVFIEVESIKFMNEEYKLHAAVYDLKRKQYQVFNSQSWEILDSKEVVFNDIASLFLEQIYLSMVFSKNTEGKLKTLDRKTLYNFRDIMDYIQIHDHLPDPQDDVNSIIRYNVFWEDHFRNTTSENFNQKKALK